MDNWMVLTLDVWRAFKSLNEKINDLIETFIQTPQSQRTKDILTFCELDELITDGKLANYLIEFLLQKKE